MTEQELEAIRKRVERATPDWSVAICRDGVYAGESCLVISRDGEVFGPRQLGYKKDENHCLNAEFAAHARQDIPALLNEIERLNKLLRKSDG